MVDARLPDGSRVNAAIPPVAIDGCSVSIRKFSKKPLTLEKLVEFGAMTQSMSDFLYGAVRSRVSTVISGGTGSGKTTLLNALSSAISEGERLITIEDAAELQLQQPHVVRAGQERPADATRPGDPGRGAVGRSLRHASGHEYRPRRLDGDDPLQQSARSHQPS
jgi:pilus assembly protein CpaF